MKVTLIIPIYNEAGHLADVLARVDDLRLPVEKELVFVDDCSTDGSWEVLAAFPFRSKVALTRQPKNRGKGAAIRAGIALATGDVIGVQDADFEYDPADIPSLIEPLTAGRADVVYGSRYKKSNVQVHRTAHYLANRFLTMLSNLASGLYLTDMETCYKFFRADVLKNIRLETNRFGFEPEVTAKVARLRLRVMELPISYYPRAYGDGKKITWRDGVAAVWHILRFNYAARQPFLPDLPAHYVPPGRQWI